MVFHSLGSHFTSLLVEGTRTFLAVTVALRSFVVLIKALNSSRATKQNLMRFYSNLPIYPEEIAFIITLVSLKCFSGPRRDARTSFLYKL